MNANRGMALGIILAAATAVAYGCSPQTRNDIKHTGQSMKDDVNETAKDLDRKVEDAMD